MRAKSRKIPKSLQGGTAPLPRSSSGRPVLPAFPVQPSPPSARSGGRKGIQKVKQGVEEQVEEEKRDSSPAKEEREKLVRKVSTSQKKAQKKVVRTSSAGKKTPEPTLKDVLEEEAESLPSQARSLAEWAAEPVVLEDDEEGADGDEGEVEEGGEGDEGKGEEEKGEPHLPTQPEELLPSLAPGIAGSSAEDQPAEEGSRGQAGSTPSGVEQTEPVVACYRKVIHIAAEDSPNVQVALAQIRAGKMPTGKVIIPGVLPYADYVKRRATWDPVKQCIGLDGRFWEGTELLLYPPLWLNRAEQLARVLKGRPRKALSIGIDPGEGTANTAMIAVDQQGVVELLSRPTPDTNVIPGEAIAFFQRHDVHPRRVHIDAGGGGKQLADRLRAMGYPVRTVAFGEPATPPPRRGMVPLGEQERRKESRTAYKNRRAQMYGMLRDALEPVGEGSQERMGDPGEDAGQGKGPGFAIPAEYTELRRQLSQIPLCYDDDGRLFIPPKRRRGPGGERSLEEILGGSPDEADALVLAVYGLSSPIFKVQVGAMW
jgi:hypothetical protein